MSKNVRTFCHFQELRCFVTGRRTNFNVFVYNISHEFHVPEFFKLESDVDKSILMGIQNPIQFQLKNER